MTSHETAAVANMHSLITRLSGFAAVNRLEVEYADLAENGHHGGPYDWQAKFHDAGSAYPERAILAGNRTGKTRTCGAEASMHATGIYPSWWKGRRFDKPTDGIVAGISSKLTRDVCQVEMMGNIDENRDPDGTGWIPKDAIVNCTFQQSGVSGVIDVARIRHISGGISTIAFMSYEQGPHKFQGVSRDWIWLDEEPEDHQVFSECQMRVLDKAGIIFISRTPLYGMSDTIRHFLDGKPGTWYITAGWDEAPHLDKKRREEEIARMNENEVATRTQGTPLMGTGAVYSTPQSTITCEPFEIPRHWPRIVGIDFGIAHEFAAVWLAHDRDTDTIYLYDGYKESGAIPSTHVSAIRHRSNGLWIPVSWPHDGKQREKGTGKELASYYRDEGAKLLAMSARFDNDRGGAQSRELAVLQILERERTGRWKVFCTQVEYLRERAMLHRDKHQKIVDVNDNLESAARYGMMMIRFAVSPQHHDMIQSVGRRRSSTIDDYDPHTILAR